MEAYLEIGFVKNQTLHSEKNKGERGVYCKGFHLETQGSESNEFLVCSKVRGFNEAKVKVIWPFHMTGCRGVFFPIGSRGTSKSRPDVGRLGGWEIRRSPLLISEKS